MARTATIAPAPGAAGTPAAPGAPVPPNECAPADRHVNAPAPARPRVPTITVGLRPHPSTRRPTATDAEPAASPAGRVLATMSAAPDGSAWFEFRLEDCRPGALRIPPAAPAGAADALWRHTCFEVFLGVPDEPGYREFNFSPSGQWAVYDFRAWRERNADFRPGAEPQLECTVRDDGLVLQAHVPAAALPKVPPGTELEVGLATVLERSDGELEYWAVQHVAAQPDFHARSTFVLMLKTLAHEAG